MYTRAMSQQAFQIQFVEVVKDLDKEEVCRQLRISEYTFDRWYYGHSKPHTLGTQSVLNVLNEMRRSLES